MPIYEYACDDCQHVTEALRAMADADEPVTCEKCASKRTRRAHSVFAAGRADAPSAGPSGAPTGCGRCGDPRGSCGM